MVEHWNEYHPGCWLTPESCRFVIGSILLLLVVIAVGVWVAQKATSNIPTSNQSRRCRRALDSVSARRAGGLK